MEGKYPDGTLLELIAEVTVRARRSASGGSLNLLEARPFTYPIDIGSNFLATCAPCDNLQCPATISDWVGGVCGNAQDFEMYPIECSGTDGG